MGRTVEPLASTYSDSDSWRVQIAVVTKLQHGPAQKVEQKLCRGRGLPFGADEAAGCANRTWAAAADDAGILQTETVRLFHSSEDKLRFRPTKLANVR